MCVCDATRDIVDETARRRQRRRDRERKTRKLSRECRHNVAIPIGSILQETTYHKIKSPMSEESPTGPEVGAGTIDGAGSAPPATNVDGSTPHDSPTSPSSSSQTLSLDDDDLSARKLAGESMTTFSDFVNNNLIAVRSGTTATILLLTAYGVSNTPLFFRFRTVADIPGSYFVGRRKLYGRIQSVKVDEQSKSIHLNVRHLSPVGQVLPKPWYDFFMRFSPMAARLAKRRSKETAEANASDLLRVRLGE